MRSWNWYYSFAALLFTLTACSHMEYAANKSYYHITTPSYKADTANAVKEQQKFRDEDSILPEKPKATSVLSVTKKDPKSLGNIYVPNSFSSSNEDLVFEIRREQGRYKAVTPFLFNSSDFNSHFSLSAGGSRALMAGVEFKIPLGK